MGLELTVSRSQWLLFWSLAREDKSCLRTVAMAMVEPGSHLRVPAIDSYSSCYRYTGGIQMFKTRRRRIFGSMIFVLVGYPLAHSYYDFFGTIGYAIFWLILGSTALTLSALWVTAVEKDN